MCPPDFFGIEYEINPWMSRSRGSVAEEAHQQWQTLYETLLGLGVQVELLQPRQGLPDLVFTANAGLVFGSRFFSSRFRHEVRARETPYFDQWFGEHGFQVVHLPEGYFFEGAGDALFCGQTLFAGYRIRSDVRGHHEIGRRFNCRVIPLELVDRYYYHLDTCYCPLAPGVAIFYPAAFDDYGRRALAEAVSELVPVTPDEARRFACNAVVVGRTVITNTGCDKLHSDLRELGLEARATPLDEFVKAGGSAKCLTLRLDGEEAATWKQAQHGERP